MSHSAPAAADDCAGVAHALAGRRGDTSDETDDRRAHEGGDCRHQTDQDDDLPGQIGHVVVLGLVGFGAIGQATARLGRVGLRGVRW